MTPPRFFVASIEPDVIAIEGDDARHAVRVLRITAGETVVVSDGAGGVATTRVLEAGRTLRAEVIGRERVAATRPRLTVYQGLPKRGKLESIVQMLIQIGVDEIVPVRTMRSVPRWQEDKSKANVDRWRAVAREAAMQSRRAWLPSVGAVRSPDEVARGTLVLHEEAPEPLSSALAASPPERIAFAAGPEGGFDPAEVDAFVARECIPVRLGRLVLRTELAPVVAATLILGRYGALG